MQDQVSFLLLKLWWDKMRGQRYRVHFAVFYLSQTQSENVKFNKMCLKQFLKADPQNLNIDYKNVNREKI